MAWTKVQPSASIVSGSSARVVASPAVRAVLEPENRDQLVTILKHHVVAGRVYADQAAKLDKAPTIGGTELPVAINDEGAKIGAANIVATDIEASNGVVHVIDTVLLP